MGICGEDRPEIQIGQQLDTVSQRLDRRQPVLLEIEAPAIVQKRRKLGLGVISQDGRRNGSRATFPGTSRPSRNAQRSAG